MGLGNIGGKFKGSFFGSGSGSSPNEVGTQSEKKGKKPEAVTAQGGSKTETKSKPQTMKISKVLAQNIIFNTTSTFISYFVNLKLPFESSRELLMHFCKKYELDQGRTHLLLSELESVQKNARYAVTYKDIKKISSDRKRKRLVLFGQEANFLTLGLVVKYIAGNDSQELRSLLMLSRRSYEMLRMPVYKQVLFYSSPERLKRKRLVIWHNILHIKKNMIDYRSLLEQVTKDSSQIKSVEEVIVLDVARSAHNMPGVDPQVLTNILKTYALYDRDIEYCQGMNFIAGFLLMMLKEEETAFKAMIQLLERFNMANLFNSDLPMLKLFFYQLDRLVSIFEPDLHTHFKDEMINSSYFASAWFITLFTKSIKYNAQSNLSIDDVQLSEPLLQLWDYFLVAGWKAILKMGLFVLRDSSSELLQLSFEEILNEITEKPKMILAPPSQTEEAKEYRPVHANLYQRLRAAFRQTEQSVQHGSMLEFHLKRLNSEFEESHSAAKLQPKHNRSATGRVKKATTAAQNPYQQSNK